MSKSETWTERAERVEPCRTPAVLTVDVEDWFHAPVHPDSGRPDRWGDLPSVLGPGVERTLDFMGSLGIRGTFFVLGWVARTRPDLVRRIAAEGHEIASHGWSHTRAFELGPARAAEEAARAGRLLEDLTGAPVLTYRAPCWSLPPDPSYYGALAAAGFTRSSSTFDPRRLKRTEGVLEVPALGASVAGCVIPRGGTVALRLLPTSWTRRVGERARRAGRPAVFWFHPWELVPEAPRVQGGALFRWVRHAGLDRLPSRLGRLLGGDVKTLSEAAQTLERRVSLS